MISLMTWEQLKPRSTLSRVWTSRWLVANQKSKPHTQARAYEWWQLITWAMCQWFDGMPANHWPIRCFCVWVCVCSWVWERKTDKRTGRQVIVSQKWWWQKRSGQENNQKLLSKMFKKRRRKGMTLNNVAMCRKIAQIGEQFWNKLIKFDRLIRMRLTPTRGRVNKSNISMKKPNGIRKKWCKMAKVKTNCRKM